MLNTNTWFRLKSTGPYAIGWLIGIVVTVVAVGVREGVVSDELQAVGEALVYLDFERVVAAGRIVAVVVAQDERDPREVAVDRYSAESSRHRFWA